MSTRSWRLISDRTRAEPMTRARLTATLTPATTIRAAGHPGFTVSMNAACGCAAYTRGFWGFPMEIDGFPAEPCRVPCVRYDPAKERHRDDRSPGPARGRASFCDSLLRTPRSDACAAETQRTARLRFRRDRAAGGRAV